MRFIHKRAELGNIAGIKRLGSGKHTGVFTNNMFGTFECSLI